MRDSAKTKAQLIAELKAARQRIADLPAETFPTPFRQSRKATEALLDHSPVCHKVIDLDLNLQYMNRSGFEMLQLTNPDEVYGKPYPFDFFPKESNRRLKAMLRDILQLPR